MQIAYRAANLADAHLLRQLMEAEGIPAFVQGEFLQGAVGELPANTEVFVRVPDEHVAAARAVVEDWERSEPVGFDDGDLDGEDPGAAQEASLRTHATVLKRLLLLIAVAVGGAMLYMAVLLYAVQ